MDFEIPSDIQAKLAELDDFIDREIKPLEQRDDNIRFFDHRREWARTDFEDDGQPRPEWEALLGEMRRRADAAGHLRFGLPKSLGGQGGSNLAMAVIREHLAAKGLGLHNDLQNESSIVGNFPFAIMMDRFGTPQQKEQFLEASLTGKARVGFGLTEPDHGSDATWLETTGVRDGNEWILNGVKRFNSGLHNATHDMIFARTSGEPGDARGITCFLVPVDTPGFKVEFMWWTFNMPTDHARRFSFTDVRVQRLRRFLAVRDGGCRSWQQTFFTREPYSAGSFQPVGAAQYCVDHEAVKYANETKALRQTPVPINQGDSVSHWWNCRRECEMLRALDPQDSLVSWTRTGHFMDVSDKVSMCNYQSQSTVLCKAADTRPCRCMAVWATPATKPFEHIYRHHRRYRITEGSEEIQIRRVAGILFGRGAKR